MAAIEHLLASSKMFKIEGLAVKQSEISACERERLSVVLDGYWGNSTFLPFHLFYFLSFPLISYLLYASSVLSYIIMSRV